MSIQHAVIADPYIHEPKGVASAAAGTIYTADGIGSGVWSPPPISGIAIEATDLLDSANIAAAQGPGALDTTYQIVFGAAAGTGADPVMIDAAGAITFNQAGSYVLRVEFQFGRSAGAGISTLHFRAKVNGTPTSRIYTAVVDNANVTHVQPITLFYNLSVADVVVFEMVRDPAGNNSGSLLAGAVTATGWLNPSPNARIVIQRLSTV